jgi:hypothetical protein
MVFQKQNLKPKFYLLPRKNLQKIYFEFLVLACRFIYSDNILEKLLNFIKFGYSVTANNFILISQEMEECYYSIFALKPDKILV